MSLPVSKVCVAQTDVIKFFRDQSPIFTSKGRAGCVRLVSFYRFCCVKGSMAVRVEPPGAQISGFLLHCLQVSASGPYPEQGGFSPHSPYLFKVYLCIIVLHMPRFCNLFFPSGFPNSILHVVCPTHLVVFDLITITLHMP
jgi:hypothetical protein